jgi:hypothetical protein
MSVESSVQSSEDHDEQALIPEARRAQRRRYVVIGSVALLIVAAVSAVAGIATGGSSGPPSPPPTGLPPGHAGAELASALGAWSTYPTNVSPRPTILLGPSVLDPQGGFTNSDIGIADDMKNSYLNGAINPPASWPNGPATAAGFKIISAQAAFKLLTTPTGGSTMTSPALTATGMQLGTGSFLSDRGPITLPAWLVTIAGVEAPAKILAIAPSGLSPKTNVKSANPAMSALIGNDERTLEVNFVGGTSGPGPCGSSYTLTTAESSHAVAVLVSEHINPTPKSTRPMSGQISCALVGELRHVTTRLSSPLGARVVVDAQNKGVVVVSPAASERH